MDQLDKVRLPLLIAEAIAKTGLHLDVMTVLTEGATGVFSATPVIAAMAGARVLAVTADSRYGTAKQAEREVTNLARACGLDKGSIRFVKKSPKVIGQADLVTNLGMLRPLDASFISAMKPGAVISLMCEAWEFRLGDVDLDACRNYGIPVVGVNENAPEIRVFEQVGLLAAKMVLESGLEIFGNRILVYSPDAFGPPIARTLEILGAKVWLRKQLYQPFPKALDLVMVADYHNQKPLLRSKYLRYSPQALVLQFCGAVDFDDLVKKGFRVLPEGPVAQSRMAKTLGHLGPRPMVELHAAGLKVGELELRLQTPSFTLVPRDRRFLSLMQNLS